MSFQLRQRWMLATASIKNQENEKMWDGRVASQGGLSPNKTIRNVSKRGNSSGETWRREGGNWLRAPEGGTATSKSPPITSEFGWKTNSMDSLQRKKETGLDKK